MWGTVCYDYEENEAAEGLLDMTHRSNRFCDSSAIIQWTRATSIHSEEFLGLNLH